MNAMTNDDLYGYQVIDQDGDKVGTVDNMWNDTDTNKLEFVSVKTGWLAGKTHIIPTANASIDTESSQITVRYSKSQVKDAPSVADGEDISPQDEDGIYEYYGLNRSTNASGSGLPASDAANTRNRDDVGDKSVTLSEEKLRVGKREVETGRVRLRKVVRTEHAEVPVDLRHEEVVVERVDANGRDVPADAFQDREVEMVTRHEEPVVGKETRVTGAVRLDKQVRSDSTSVGDDVRHEDVEVEGDGTVKVPSSAGRR